MDLRWVVGQGCVLASGSVIDARGVWLGRMGWGEVRASIDRYLGVDGVSGGYGFGMLRPNCLCCAVRDGSSDDKDAVSMRTGLLRRQIDESGSVS